MHPDNKRAIIEKINDIITHPTDPPPPPTAPQRLLVVKGGQGFSIVGKQQDEFEDICHQLLREKGWSEKFSRSHIEQAVNKMFHALFREGNSDNTQVYLEQLLIEHDTFTQENTVYLPIDGIIMLIDSLQLGKIRVVNMRGKQLEDLEHQVKSRIFQYAPNQPQGEQEFHNWKEHALPILQGKAVAVYTAVAETRKLQELAESEWRQVVDLLRYLIFIGFQKIWDVSIGLKGDVRYGLREAVILPASGPGFATTHTSKSPQPLRIDQTVVALMRAARIFDLAEQMHPSNKTAFSDALLQGIHWVANALTQEEPSNEYLSLVSCLETFLTRDKTDLGSITNAVAGGVGWVLEERDSVKRPALFKKIKKYYQKRSTISHGGRGDEIEKDLPELRTIVSHFITKMVERQDEFKFSGIDGLHEWIDQGPIRRV